MVVKAEVGHIDEKEYMNTHTQKKCGSEVCSLYGSNIIYVHLNINADCLNYISACHNGRELTC